jgi:TRAP transporter 4TM/12TM fusion protein
LSEIEGRGWRAATNRWMELLGETQRVRPGGATGALLAVLSVLAIVVISWFALYATATQQLQVLYYLLLLLPISFLTTTAHLKIERLMLLDYLLAAVAFAATLWFVVNEQRYANWVTGFSALSQVDIIAGTTLFVLCLELCRRAVGFGLTSVLLVLLAYVAFGQLIPGSFRHSGISYTYFLEMQTIGTDGLFGDPVYVAAKYAFLFVLFGNLFVISGGAQLFFDVAAAVTGRSVGGPAKACIVSSALYGTVSGSPVADVATTGPITIPIMKRIGLSAERAGAIEASSSIGGALLPPVMGAVAFLMADFTGLPYYLIAWYATLPSLGYYLGVFALVHFEAVRLNLGRVPEEEIVGLRVALARNWPSLIPIMVLLWLLVAGYSAAYVAAGSALSVVLASWLRRDTAIGPRRFVEACVETCLAMVPLTAAVAAGGIIIGAIELTGLAGKFTLLLFQFSAGLLVPSLILAGVVLILLGTGMPTTATYIMGVALLVPLFVGKFGLPAMDVHMFMLFYASLSAITPPVAVAAFAAAAIAGANPFKLAPYACKLSVGGFVVPFFFVFNNGILMQGSVFHILSDTAVCTALVITSSLVLHGYVRQRPIPWGLRGVFALAALAMAVPNLAVQYGAIACSAGLYLALLRGDAVRSSVAVRPAEKPATD